MKSNKKRISSLCSFSIHFYFFVFSFDIIPMNRMLCYPYGKPFRIYSILFSGFTLKCFRKLRLPHRNAAFCLKETRPPFMFPPIF